MKIVNLLLCNIICIDSVMMNPCGWKHVRNTQCDTVMQMLCIWCSWIRTNKMHPYSRICYFNVS